MLVRICAQEHLIRLTDTEKLDKMNKLAIGKKQTQPICHVESALRHKLVNLQAAELQGDIQKRCAKCRWDDNEALPVPWLAVSFCLHHSAAWEGGSQHIRELGIFHFHRLTEMDQVHEKEMSRENGKVKENIEKGGQR